MRFFLLLAALVVLTFPLAPRALAQDDDGLQVGDVNVRLTAMEGPAVQLDIMKSDQTHTYQFSMPEWQQFLTIFRNTARTDNYEAPNSRGIARDEFPMGELKGVHFIRYLDPEYGVEAILTDGKHTLVEFDSKHAYLFFQRGVKLLPPAQ